MAYGPGSGVLGRYRLVRIIGRGGMAIVWEAVDLRLAIRVALKMLDDEARNDKEVVARFAREAYATDELDTAFVARVLDEGTAEDGTPFIALEHLEGRDLGAVLRKHGTIPWDEAVAYVVQACAAVAAAHDRGIIHRDIKPANLFVEDTPSSTAGRRVRVLDFGVAKDPQSRQLLTDPDVMLGTTMYMSPEQLRNPRDVDARADVWALGLILYRAIVGSLPMRGSTAAVIARIIDDEPIPNVDAPGVPRALIKVIARALDKNRAGRPMNARALALALEPFARRSPGVDAAMSELRRSDPKVIVAEAAPARDAASPCSDPPRPKRSSIPPALRAPIEALARPAPAAVWAARFDTLLWFSFAAVTVLFFFRCMK